MRTKTLIPCITLIVAVILAVAWRRAYSGAAPVWELSFKDAASGGSLVLAKTRNRNMAYVSIQTSPGESAESVAERLADAINGSHAEQNVRGSHYDPHWLWVGGYQVSASGSKLILPGTPDEYIVAGTETGLGIPPAPRSLSCSFNQEKGEIVLRWVNPPRGYDLILAQVYWARFDRTATTPLPGTSRSFSIDTRQVPLDVNDVEFRVVGIRNGIGSRAATPSNASAVHVSNSGHCQEETYGIPFAAGIAPNWTAWSTAAETDGTAFEQGQKYPAVKEYNPAQALLTKPFYQIIKAPPRGAAHGVRREFLGLTPGHTYRLTACLTTLEMDSAAGDWSISLCAVPGRPDGKHLAVEQLAGLATLPDGRNAVDAGRIISYGPGNTTRGLFELVFSHKDATGSTQTGNITLPAGVDTITVWVRFVCEDPKGKVGFSGVKLEDVSAIGDLKSPEQIMLEEHQHEKTLLQWVAQSSRTGS